MKLSHLGKHCPRCRGDPDGLTARPKLGKHRPQNGKRKVTWWQDGWEDSHTLPAPKQQEHLSPLPTSPITI